MQDGNRFNMICFNGVLYHGNFIPLLYFHKKVFLWTTLVKITQNLEVESKINKIVFVIFTSNQNLLSIFKFRD